MLQLKGKAEQARQDKLNLAMNYEVLAVQEVLEHFQLVHVYFCYLLEKGAEAADADQSLGTREPHPDGGSETPRTTGASCDLIKKNLTQKERIPVLCLEYELQRVQQGSVVPRDVRRGGGRRLERQDADVAGEVEGFGSGEVAVGVGEREAASQLRQVHRRDRKRSRSSSPLAEGSRAPASTSHLCCPIKMATLCVYLCCRVCAKSVVFCRNAFSIWKSKTNNFVRCFNSDSSSAPTLCCRSV